MRTVALYVIALLFSVAAHGQFFPNSEPSLWDGATLYRDEWGVPHVFANDTRSMAFVFGYAQAEDHLEGMLLGYRVANGRAAEVLGESYVESDSFAQVMRYRENAQRAYETADAVTVDLCEGFAQGVNAWILEHPKSTPSWAEPVAPADILAFMQYYLLSMAPFDDAGIYHPEPGTPAANAWALAPSRTVDGKAVLVINPQQDYDGVFKWYEAHLATRGMNMYGATLYGLPVILQGHNEHLGWALSPNEPDIADLYIEYPHQVFHAADPKSVMQKDYYTRQNVWFTYADTRTLFVWEAGRLNERPLNRLATRHGPVVGYYNGQPLAYRVGGYRLHGALRQVYDMARATDLASFRAALDRTQLPVFHVVYADTSGNLFYRYNAKTGWKDVPSNPIVIQLNPPDPKRWRAPVSALESGSEWGPDMMPGELPWLLNPASGYVQASGTPPWRVTEGSPLTESQVAPWLAMDTDSYRAKRIRALLGQGALRFEDQQALLFDRVSPLAAETIPYLISAADRNQAWVKASHPDVWVALDTLRAWDYVADTDSVGMTLFHVWWSLLQSESLADTDEGLHALMLEDTEWMRQQLLTMLAEATRLIRNEYQTLDVPWGRVHLLRRGSREVAVGGSVNGQSLFAMGDHHFERGAWRAARGPGFAMAVQFSSLPRSVSLVPFGTSDVPESAHYADQLNLLLEQRMKVTRFSRAEVEAHAASIRGKAIALRPKDSGVSFLVQAPQPITMHLGTAPALQANLPDGTAVFSRYVEPVVEPYTVPIVVDMEFYIPESLCADSHLPRLAVYAYRPQTGWQYIQDQEMDPERRTLWARGFQAQVYAVLGPLEYLTGDVKMAAFRPYTPTQTVPPVSVVSDLTTAEARTLPPRLPKGETGLSAMERRRIARALPEPASVAAPSQVPEPVLRREKSAFRMFGDLPIPQLPPGWTPDKFDPAAMLPRPSEPAAKPSGVMLRPSIRAAAPSDGEPESVKRDDAESPLTVTSKQPSVDMQPLPETPAMVAPQKIAAVPPRSRDAASPQANRDPSLDAGLPVITSGSYTRRNSRLIMSSETPLSLRDTKEAPRTPSPRGYYLAPDPNRASNMEIGKSMELRPPIYNALFLVKTDRSVRGQVAVLDRPPAAYPTGLTAFTPVLDVLTDPSNIRGSLVINWQVPPGVCRADRAKDLRLYVYDAQAGWAPVKGQKINEDTLRFGALDRTFRTYAVLGPISARLRQPENPGER
jgi:acyl-homoserine-lactone acylase